MSEEQEKKMDQLLEAVARKYEVRAPEELPRLIEEALEREKPRPLYRSWQPAFAVLVVGLSAGVMLNKMRREGLAPEVPLPVAEGIPEYRSPEGSPEPTFALAQKAAPAREAKKAKELKKEAREDLGRSAAAPAAARQEAASPERLSAPDTRRSVDLAAEELAFPGPAATEGQGAKSYLASEKAPQVTSAMAMSEDSRVKKPVAPPSYDEFMSNVERYLQAGQVEGALVYWNGALGLMASETKVLPRVLDIRRSRAWLSLGRGGPVLRFLKELEKRKTLSVTAEEIKSWIALLESGQAEALNTKWEKWLEGRTQP